MTALAGIWSFDAGIGPLAACERMLAGQRIYAPDPPVCVTHGSISLGRRLFRSLPEDRYDRGPAVSGNGRWSLVADVRIDNREELAAALSLPGDTAAGLSDAAIVLRALERWEEAAIDRLLGDFALAAWDSEKQRLLLARDFLGQRPLHYHAGDGFFAFASMPKGLHALPEIPYEPDEDAVAEFLANIPETTPRSFFRNVRRVLPGHYCIVSKAGIESVRYWDPPRTTLRLGSPEAYAEAVRGALDEAVRVRLRGTQGRVAAHLSGGLDSGAVAATAARLDGAGRVVAFTAVPREGYEGEAPAGRFGDEGSHAAAVAALYPNMEHVLIRTNGKSPLAALDLNFYVFDSPMLSLCNGVWGNAIMDEARRRRLPILLVGFLGNLSFSYAGMELLPELFRRGRWLRLAGEAWRLRRSGIRLRSVASHAFGPFLPAALWRAINRWHGRLFALDEYSAVQPARAAELEAKAQEAALDFSYRPRRDPFATRLWAAHRSDPGNYAKGCLGGWGIELRDPTADRRLVELCLSIPADQYLRHGETRALARRAFADRLPETVVRETRKGLQAIDWHEGLSAARDEVALEVERIAETPGATGTLDVERMKALVENWPENDDWVGPVVASRYRLALLRGLSAGHFMRKATRSNG